MASFFRKKAKEELELPSTFKKEATRITIRFNAGFKNTLYVRGKGAGLSWDRGVQLKNTGPDEWVWEINQPFNECEFKVLINDKQYEVGENHHARGGISFQYTPKF
jgi:hypothetical protein